MFTRLAISTLLVLSLAAVLRAESGESAAEKRRVAYDARLGMTAYDTYRAVAQIDIRRPIGEFEAYALAKAYFLAQVSGCGCPDVPKDKGERWVAETKEGFAGEPGPKIIVEKKTGVTSSVGGPRVRDPKEYLKYIKNI